MTDEERETACGSCGLPVLQRRVETAVGLRWRTQRHNCPGGYPCVGGGVSVGVYRSGQRHSTWEGCPVCGPGSPEKAFCLAEQSEGNW